MKREKCLQKIIVPSMRRQGKKHGGVMQILLTNECGRSCRSCTQQCQVDRPHEHMSVANFKLAMESLKDYPFIFGIFGGSPTLNPHFEEICEILRTYVPQNKTGLWCDDLRGHAKTCAKTFSPAFSNLNVHMNKKSHNEIRTEWTAAKPFGLQDSRHSPSLVAMVDVIDDEDARWDLISRCTINQNWSAMVGQLQGQLYGYFCEVNFALDSLHYQDGNWGFAGIPITEDDEMQWWKRPVEAFEKQIDNCHKCGIPMNIKGSLACRGKEQISKTHADVFNVKDRRKIEVVDNYDQLEIQTSHKTTNYTKLK